MSDLNPVKIAIYGPAGSGKDFVAKAMIKSFQEDLGVDMKRFAFADNLKKITNTLLGLNDTYIQELAVYSEDFKNKYFIDLDTLDKMWLYTEVPEVYTKRGPLGENQQILYKFKDQKSHETNGWFTIYTANSLFELYQRASSYEVIPNMVQSWSAETVEYPEGYKEGEDTYKRLISYREYIVWIGTYCFQNLLGKNCLVNSMMNSQEFNEYSANRGKGVVITDLRFPHEFEACKKRGFKIVRIKTEKKEIDIDNIAETYYSEFKEDFVFYNHRDERLFKNEMKRLENFIRYICQQNEKNTQ